MKKKIKEKIKKIETLLNDVKNEIEKTEKTKIAKKQNKVISKFYYTIPSVNKKSIHSYIVNTFGELDKKLNKKIMKFSLGIDKKIIYNNHTFELKYFDNRLILLIDDILPFEWDIYEIYNKSKLDTSLIKKSLKQKKIKVIFNQKTKNHGTQFIIYK